MKKFILMIAAILIGGLMPAPAMAAGGIFASGGGSHVEGDTFSVTVKASGATFNAFQGTISVSGPVSVVSIGAGSATWVKQPSNGGQFVGMVTSPTSSLTVATIKLKGTKPGSGAVNISGVSLANNGAVAGTGAGGADFTITRAPTLPGEIAVTSSSHPDQTQQYEATTIVLAWTKPTNGATGYSYLLDSAADTTPAQKATSADSTVTYADQAIGVHYFHIRGQNADGWGPTTHFKITIKEPENSVIKQLSGPKNITITKATNFKNDVKNGTVTGLVIKGTVPTKTTMDKYVPKLDSAQAQDPVILAKAEIYQANVMFTPALTLPEGKTLSVTPDKNGNFRLVIDYPIPAGFYKLTVQGQRAKILTKPSSEIRFQISQQNGGKIVLLSDKDAKEIIPPKPTLWQKYQKEVTGAGIILVVELLVLAGIVIVKKIQNRQPGEKLPQKKKPAFNWE